MITISTNIAVGAGSIVMFAGFMLGYAIAWRQRRLEALPDPKPSSHGVYLQLGGPVDLDELAALRESLEGRVRRSQA